MNKRIREFKQVLIDFVNGYDIPIEVKRMIFSEVYTLIEQKANEIIEAESNEKTEDK